MGALFGWRLRDGSRVALKVHVSARDRPFTPEERVAAEEAAGSTRVATRPVARMPSARNTSRMALRDNAGAFLFLLEGSAYRAGAKAFNRSTTTASASRLLDS